MIVPVKLVPYLALLALLLFQNTAFA